MAGRLEVGCRWKLIAYPFVPQQLEGVAGQRLSASDARKQVDSPKSNFMGTTCIEELVINALKWMSE